MRESHNNYIIALPLEVKARDLDPRLYLACRFLEKGIRVVIGYKAGVHRFMRRTDSIPIYFDKGFHAPFENFYRDIRRRSGAIVGLDEEGGLVAKGEVAEQYILARVSPLSLPFVNRLFVWGGYQKQVISKARPQFPEKHIIISGHPRFDLRKPCFDKFYQRSSEDIGLCFEDQNQGILVNSSFYFSNNAMDSTVIWRINEPVLGRAVMQRYVDYHERLLIEFISLTKDLSARYPARTIFFRPHPVERPETYLKAFKSLENVVVASAGSVHEYLVHSCVVIHHDCTTGVEAIFHQSRVVSYQPVYDESLCQALPVQVSEVAHTKSEIFEIVDGIKEAAPLSSAVEEAIVERIANYRCKSADIIVRETLSMLTALQDENAKEWGRFNLRVATDNIKARVSDRMRAIVKPKQARQQVVAQNGKFPGLEVEEIRRKLDLFQQCGVIVPEIDVTPTKMQAFVLSV